MPVGYMKVDFDGLVHVVKEAYVLQGSRHSVGTYLASAHTLCGVETWRAPAVSGVVKVVDDPISCVACLADGEHGL